MNPPGGDPAGSRSPGRDRRHAQGQGAARQRQKDDGGAGSRPAPQARRPVAPGRYIKIEFDPSNHRPRCRRTILSSDRPQSPRPGSLRRSRPQRNSRRLARRTKRQSSSPADPPAFTIPAAPPSIPRCSPPAFPSSASATASSSWRTAWRQCSEGRAWRIRLRPTRNLRTPMRSSAASPARSRSG